ncbi:helix-turn-helix domain-containing protein [Myxococcota bacterium]
MRACNGNQTRAAENLRIPRRTLVHKMKGLGVRNLGYDIS